MFWDCSSSNKWLPYLVVDKENKQLKINTIFPCKSFWEFSKKEEFDSILKNWQITFQASDYKGNNFLDLNYNNNLPTRLIYSKRDTWLKHFGHSNILCACAVRAITNYALISKYCLSIFSKESFTCSYKDYPIETRNHILYSCKYYKMYWNSKRDLLKDIITFFKFNPGVFSFHEDIT